MAHEIQKIGDEYSMAFVGETPWHGFGQKLDEEAPLEVWAERAHLDWKVKSSPVTYHVTDFNGEVPVGRLMTAPDRKVLYRSDNFAKLGIVSNLYKEVQPIEVLNFFRALIDQHNFKMHTAGSLQEGRRIWALADVGKSFRLMGQDEVKGFLLLATSYDASLSTTAMFTSVRVVCNNTLQWAYDIGQNRAGSVKVPHLQVFDAGKVQFDMGVMNENWQDFEDDATFLSETRISKKEAVSFFMGLFHNPEHKNPITGEQDFSDIPELTVKRLFKVYQGSVGQDIRSSKDTAWGLVNAVSRFYDHERPVRKGNSRMNSSWFDVGATVKKDAWDQAIELAKAA